MYDLIKIRHPLNKDERSKQEIFRQSGTEIRAFLRKISAQSEKVAKCDRLKELLGSCRVQLVPSPGLEAA